MLGIKKFILIILIKINFVKWLCIFDDWHNRKFYNIIDSIGLNEVSIK